MLPPDIINFLRYAQDCGFAPLDLMAADLLKKYTTQQVGPSEFKEYETWAIVPELRKDTDG
jgi:hypothetical protein